MAWRSNIILAGVAVVLGVLCVVDAHVYRSPEELAEAEKKVFDFEEGSLRGFEITREGEMFRVEKSESIWYVTDPIVYRADPSVAENVEFELQSLRKEWTQDAPDLKQLDKYGLTEPRLRFRFWVTDQPEEVEIGDEDPGGGVYIRVKGRGAGLYTVRRSLYDTLARDLKDFRERRLIPFETYNVQTLILQEGPWQVRWDRLDDGWMVHSPKVSDRGDGEKVDEILRGLQALEAEGFIDGVDEEAAAAYGFTGGGPGVVPRVIRVGLKNDADAKIAELGKPFEQDGKKVIPARRVPLEQSGTVILLPESVLDQFGGDFGSFRSRIALPFSIYDVESLTYRSGEDELALAKEKGEWQVTAPKKTQPDPGEVQSLLRVISELEIEDFVEDRPEDLGPYGLEAGVRSITVTTEDGTHGLRIGAAREERGSVYAMRLGQESVYAILPGALPPGPREAYFGVLKRRVLDFSTFHAHVLDLGVGDSKKTFRKTEGKWMDGDEERRDAGEVVLSLASLQAMRFVADSGDGAEFGLDSPSLVVSVELKDEAGTRHTVSFGDDAGVEGRYARVEGSDFIFLASPILFEDLLKLR